MDKCRLSILQKVIVTTDEWQELEKGRSMPPEINPMILTSRKFYVHN
jgi:hypothetical protein